MDWNSQLAEVEDEYLIGLTNKGIVKRAYKDKETADIKILKREDEAALQVDRETVTLCIPLGESKCSCPSRSICRHIILGILALKESVSGDRSAARFSGNSFSAQDNHSAAVSENSLSETARQAGSPSLQERLWEEIRAFPEKDIYKIIYQKKRR